MVNDKKYGEILANWQIPEFQKYPRTFTWYFLIIVIGLGLLTYAIVNVNFLFALILIISGTIIFLHERREPAMLDFQITEDGVLLADKFFPYKEIKGFWIIYEPPQVKNLYFKLDRLIHGNLSIPLIRMNPLYVRKILLKYLAENLENEGESSDDQIGRVLKI